MFRPYCSALLVCAISAAWAAPGPAPDPAVGRAGAALAQLPLRFEANQGQSDASVRYIARTASYNLLLKSRGATLALPGSRRVEISLENSNASPRIEGCDKLAARTNYLIGNRASWHTDVPSYSRVRYYSVYHGIDVVYYGNRNQLEYDFVLQPGADPRAIRMKFRGAKVRISPEGDLVIETGGSQVVQKKPFIYQEASGKQVEGRYVMLARNVAGLRVDRYDRKLGLVIDPTVQYQSYIGGTGADHINAVKITPQGMLYMAGDTATGDFTAAGNSYDPNQSGLTDIFVAILDTTPAGGYNLVYLTYMGGSNNDIALAMDVGAAGVFYLTGTTTSPDFPVTSNAFQTTGAGSTTESFVAQIDPSQAGTAGLLFSSFLGGTTGANTGRGIVVDPQGLIDVIGTTKSTDFPVTASAYQAAIWGPQDTFLCQVDPVAGAINYATYLGGEAEDDGRAILVDKKGLVYFAASTLSSQFPQAAFNYHGTPFGAEDVIVGIMDFTQQGSASLVYSTYFGGSANDEVRGMAWDAKGNLLITGYTLSGDFPVTGNAVQRSYSGNSDAWVAVANPTILGPGFLLYSTYLGGAHGDVGYGVAGDSSGSIYVTGYTLSSDFPATADALQAVWGQGTNLFITKINPAVSGKNGIQFSTFLGATGTYQPTAIAVGPDGRYFVVGYGNSGLPTQGGYSGGGTDGYVLAVGQ